jgi:hypothetical protein
MRAQKLLILGYALAFGFLACPLAQADMIVKTKDGKTFSLPVKAADVVSIRFSDTTTTLRKISVPKRSAPPKKDIGPDQKPEASQPKEAAKPAEPATPAKTAKATDAAGVTKPKPKKPTHSPRSVEKPQGRVVVNIWNNQACGQTDNAGFELKKRRSIKGMVIWRNWLAGEHAVKYVLYQNGRKIYSGKFTRGDCDVSKAAWCEGVTLLHGRLNPGNYQVRLIKGGLCRNAASGAGFIRVYSTDD